MGIALIRRFVIMSMWFFDFLIERSEQRFYEQEVVWNECRSLEKLGDR